MLKLKTLNRAIFILAIVGFVIAGYVLQGYLRHASVYCPVGGGCDLVRKSPYAWPLGIPVPAVGFVGYAVIFTLAYLRTTNVKNEKKLLLGLVGMSAFGAAFVTWFTLTEALVIKSFCSWCVVSAVDMYTIFGLTLTSFRISKQKKV